MDNLQSPRIKALAAADQSGDSTLVTVLLGLLAPKIVPSDAENGVTHETLVNTVSKFYKGEFGTYGEGNKIVAIKLFRTLTRAGLLESKNWVEQYITNDTYKG